MLRPRPKERKPDWFKLCVGDCKECDKYYEGHHSNQQDPAEHGSKGGALWAWNRAIWHSGFAIWQTHVLIIAQPGTGDAYCDSGWLLTSVAQVVVDVGT